MRVHQAFGGTAWTAVYLLILRIGPERVDTMLAAFGTLADGRSREIN